MDSLRNIYKTFPTLFICAALMTGCARGPNPQDPYEHYNRNAYRLNHDLDVIFFKPVAKGYKAVTPYPVRRHVTNVFNNLSETKNIANDALQARAYWTFNDLWRFIINSTVGVVGIFDVATDIGLPRHINNFGLTMSEWGYKNPPFVIIPLLGPSTTAGLIGVPVDYISVPWRYEIEPTYLQYVLPGLELINTRANYLDQENLTSQLSLDPYIFMRSAFMQNRAYLQQINANPPLQNTPAAYEAEAALEQQPVNQTGNQ